MQTVAILNAGLGDLSIGFQLAGFNVIVAYEPDLKALSIHKANLDIPIYPELHEDSIKDSLPDFDVLAAHLYFSKPSNKAKIGNLKSELSVNIILRILRSKRVKAFFFIVNKTVVMNEVSDTVKNNIHQKFGIFIWDIANLLWLFNEFPDIKNEFIALLDFTVDSIEAKQPEPFILDEDNLKREKDKSKWEVALARIEPGKAQFKEYETECIRILKYILGNFLTLWETQEQSNGGLYRFDMCCKIKNGANKDFFDTIMHYFGTKYIVFEFKNYNEKISQKEIYTTEKYLYEKALRKVAIIVSRCGADEHALQAARGSLRETGKLILCLSDNDLLKMIKIKEQGEQDPADFLGELLDDLLVHLEK